MTSLTSPAPAPLADRRRRHAPAGTYQVLVWVAVAALTIAPLVPLAITSLRSKPYYLPGGVLTTSAYTQVLTDPAFHTAVINTLIFAAGTTLIAVALGAGFAILVARTDLPGRRRLGPLLLAPILIPPLGLIVGWESIYGQTGYLTQLWHRNLHLPAWNLSSLPGMIALGAVVTLPVAYLTCRAALEGADGSLEDAVRASGGGTGHVLRTVTLPQLRTALIDAAMLIFALCLENLGIPLFLGRPAGIDFVASYLYDAWSNSAVPDPPSVSAGALILLVAVLVIVALRIVLLRHSRRYAASPRAIPPLPLGRARTPAALGVGAFVTVTAVIPLLGLALMSSVADLTTLVPPWHMWTAANWRSLNSDPTLHRAIINSLIVSGVGAAATVALVTTATIIAGTSRLRLRRSLPVLLILPRTTPGIVFGVGFFWLYLIMGTSGSFLRTSIWGEALALSVRSLTLAYIVIAPALARLSPELERASTASGAGWWATARRITAPLLAPAIRNALILMFVTLFSDYDPVVFLAKPGSELLSTSMLATWSKGLPGPVAALALLQVAVVAAALALGFGLRRTRSRATAKAGPTHA